jgi:RimJ/RimL family protein N-acetyltransferase
MTHPIWPLFDLRVVTPRLELRYIDDEMGAQLALLAAKGIHDPEFMPFSIEWTDAPSPQLERTALQYYWKIRAELSPTDWTLAFAVLVGGAVVGTTSLGATAFPTLRQFETGSWLGREHQGKGIGTAMRLATVQLGVVGLGAQWATTGAFEDNAASLTVTTKLGYTVAGRRRVVSRGASRRLVGYEMEREHFLLQLRRDDIVLDGIEPCLPLLGLTA